MWAIHLSIVCFQCSWAVLCGGPWLVYNTRTGHLQDCDTCRGLAVSEWDFGVGRCCHETVGTHVLQCQGCGPCTQPGKLELSVCVQFVGNVAGAHLCVCVYLLRLVSPNKILFFRNIWIIMIHLMVFKLSAIHEHLVLQLWTRSFLKREREKTKNNNKKPWDEWEDWDKSCLIWDHIWFT